MPEYCPRCDRPVYFAEEILALSQKWHKLCFKCGKLYYKIVFKTCLCMYVHCACMLVLYKEQIKLREVYKRPLNILINQKYLNDVGIYFQGF